MKSEGEEKRRKLEIRDGHRWLSRIRGRGGYSAIDRGERKRRSSPRLGRNLIKDSIGAGAVRSGQYKINMCDGQRCSTFRPFSLDPPPSTPQPTLPPSFLYTSRFPLRGQLAAGTEGVWNSRVLPGN